MNNQLHVSEADQEPAAPFTRLMRSNSMSCQRSIFISGCRAHGTNVRLARALAQRGHVVFVGVPDPSRLPKDVCANREDIVAVEVDTRDPCSVRRAAASVGTATRQRGMRGLDVLVVDAGVDQPLQLLKMTMDKARGEYDARVSEALALAASFVDLLAARRGRVLNVSSSGVFVAAPGMNLSSETAILDLSAQMRRELTARGVGVTSAMVETLPSSAAEPECRVVLPGRWPGASSVWAVLGRLGCVDKPRGGRALDPLLQLMLGDGSGWGWPWRASRCSRADDMSRMEQGVAPIAV